MEQPPQVHRFKRALWDSLPTSTGAGGYCGTASPRPQAQEGTVGQPPHVHRRRRALWGQPGSTSWGQSVLLQGPRWQGAEAEHCPHWDSGTHRRWEEGGLD